MMAEQYRHIRRRGNKLGRHYSGFRLNPASKRLRGNGFPTRNPENQGRIGEVRLAEERDGAHPIVAWRHHRGLTQTGLAAASGIERSYLAHLESRRKNGAPETLAAIARALGCFIDDLIRTSDAAGKGIATKPGAARRRRGEAA
jgi:DNA-binding Xre family transcriptional regulator